MKKRFNILFSLSLLLLPARAFSQDGGAHALEGCEHARAIGMVQRIEKGLANAKKEEARLMAALEEENNRCGMMRDTRLFAATCKAVLGTTGWLGKAAAAHKKFVQQLKAEAEQMAPSMEALEYETCAQALRTKIASPRDALNDKLIDLKSACQCQQYGR